MKDFWRRLWKNLKKPRGWWLGVLYFVTVISCAVAIALVVDSETGAILRTFSYVAYAIAGLTLAYTVYTFVVYVPIVKRKLSKWIRRSPFGRHLLVSYGFRTVIFSAFSLIFNVGYVVFHIVIAVTELSLWYGSLAAYYGLLVALRSGIIFYHSGKRRKSRSQREHIEHRQYRTCGILLTIMPLFLAVPIAGVVFMGKAFIHEGWTVIAFAAYAFYKITMAIWNLVKTRDVKDMTVKALRNVGFADALMSMFSLQTALLFAFSQGQNHAVINGLTGGVVCLFTVLLGVFMLVRAHKKGKEIKGKNKYEGRE